MVYNTFFFTQNDLNVWQRCWEELLIEYDFEVSYLNGTMNRVEDVLSWRPDIFSSDTCSNESV
jgi:hypothetical protein